VPTGSSPADPEIAPRFDDVGVYLDASSASDDFFEWDQDDLATNLSNHTARCAFREVAHGSAAHALSQEAIEAHR
jgi:hypothetical protein